MEPLDPELRRIIQAGLAQAAPGPEVEARVLAGLLRRLPRPPEGGSGPGGDTIGGTPAAVTKLATGLKALVIAGALGTGVVLIASPPREAPRTTNHERTPPPAPPIPTPATVEPAPPVFTPPPSRKPPTTKPRALEPPSDPLLAETRMLAEAEAALTRGELGRAVELARVLAHSHPTGQLVLEREAIEISARCGLAEPGASAAAHTFLALHPDAALASKIRTRCAHALLSESENSALP